MRCVAGLGLAFCLAACATRSAPPPTPRPALIVTRAVPVDWPGPLPATLTGPERIWHLRAALNVAALSCPTKTGPAIVSNYNDFLKAKKPLLAAAYNAEIRQFQQFGAANWQPAFDRYMTKLYNRYAWPPVQARFCATANTIAPQALQTANQDFEAFATDALARIEQAMAFTPPTTSPVYPAATQALALATTDLTPWRIQLGAFTGQPAATAAWAQIKSRLPGLSAYVPHFEPVPGKPELVRLQIGNATDRSSALTLCALAAAGGFDCIPVRPGR